MKVSVMLKAILERIEKAEKYMDDPEIPVEEKEKHVPRLLELFKKADELMKESEG